MTLNLKNEECTAFQSQKKTFVSHSCCNYVTCVWLVSHLRCTCVTCITIVLHLYHLYRNCVALVLLVWHSCCTRVARAALASLASGTLAVKSTARFFISKNFISNARLRLSKNQANAKQHPEAELLVFENYSHSWSTLSSKND